MASSITSVEKLGPGAFRYAYTGTAPFAIVKDGVLVVESTEDTEYFAFNLTDPLEPPAVEVFDSTEDYTGALTFAFSPLVRLQWYGSNLENGFYLVEQFIDAVWTTIGRVAHRLDGYQSFVTDALEDETNYVFRVTAVDSRQVSSPVEDYDVFLVRIPAPPRIALSYVGGTSTLTVSAR